MQAIYDFLYSPGLPLKPVGLVIGLWLLASHVFALVKPEVIKPHLKSFPRNEKIGIPLVIFCFAWGFVIWSCMDLGEFYKIERVVQVVIAGVCIGVIVQVREFLAVRALGFFLILVAAPLLDAAFLEEPKTRLLLVALAYAGALKGMFWIGMPFLLRDQINWLLEKDARLKVGAFAGAVYGLILLICALLFW
jgi:hypothetical protein